MTPEQIKSKVGQRLTEAETAAMIGSNPIGTSPDDDSVRSGVLSFSFGRGGVFLTDAEIRTPTGQPAHGDGGGQ